MRMTLDEFNEKYYVVSKVMGYQIASIRQGEVEYGEVEEVDGISYLVLDNATDKAVFTYYDASEQGFLQAIGREFNIIDLPILI